MHPLFKKAVVSVVSVFVLSSAVFPSSAKVPAKQEVMQLAAHIIAPRENELLYTGKITDSTIYYYSTKPDDINGCNTGFGIDLGYLTPNRMYQWFKPVLSKKKIEALQQYAELKGKDAFNKCKNNNDNATIVSRYDSIGLMMLYIDDSYYHVRRKLDKEKIGSLNFCQTSILVALDYQSPVLFSRASKLPTLLKAANWKSAVYEIQHNSGSQRNKSLQKRRNWEATLFALYSREPEKCNQQAIEFLSRNKSFDLAVREHTLAIWR